MVSTTNLIAYYKLDETSGTTAYDAHTNSYDATNNGCTINVAGIINTQYNGDTSGDDITCPSGVTNSIGTGDFSISAWFSPNANVSAYTTLFWNGTASTSNSQIRLYWNSGNLYFGTIKNGEGWNTAGAAQSLNSGTAYHIVCTYDATNKDMRLYVNGSELANYTRTSALTALDSPLRFLQLDTYTSSPATFNGKIDEIAIFSEELTSTNVTELYNSGNGLAYPFSSDGTISPSTLSLSLTNDTPIIVLNGSWGTPQALTLSLLAPTLDGATVGVAEGVGAWEVGTGTKSTRYLTTKWPITEGLILGTTKIHERKFQLTPTRKSIIYKKDRKGL